MVKIILKVDGMKCGMCESHVNDVVRKVADVRKVASSHARGETVVICENDVDDATLRDAIAEQGYVVTGITRQPYEKKGMFSLFKR